MKKLIYIPVVLLFLMGCTAPGRLTKKFSERPIVVTTQFRGESYANVPAEIPRRYTVMKYNLWDQLRAYRMESDTLPSVPDEAGIRLSLVKNDFLKVAAYREQQLIARFDIPVRKKGKYLILKKRRKMIPLPIIYFDIEEDITILAPLENSRIGFHSYSDHSLWILFFGASNTGHSIEEYERKY